MLKKPYLKTVWLKNCIAQVQSALGVRILSDKVRSNSTKTSVISKKIKSNFNRQNTDRAVSAWSNSYRVGETPTFDLSEWNV